MQNGREDIALPIKHWPSTIEDSSLMVAVEKKNYSAQWDEVALLAVGSLPEIVVKSGSSSSLGTRGWRGGGGTCDRSKSIHNQRLCSRCGHTCEGWLVLVVCGSWQTTSKGTGSDGKRWPGEARWCVSVDGTPRECHQKSWGRTVGAYEGAMTGWSQSPAWSDVGKGPFHVVYQHWRYLDPGKSVSEINTYHQRHSINDNLLPLYSVLSGILRG